MSSDKAHHKQVSGWLGVSKRVNSVTAVSDDVSLTKYLRLTTCHLCILLIDNNEQALPNCILQHPQLRVLVIITTKPSGAPELLYQQGATDVVTLLEPKATQHAISRLIDECVQHFMVEQLERHNEQLQTEVEALRLFVEEPSANLPFQASNDNSHSDAHSRPYANELQFEPAPKIENIIKSNMRDRATGLPSRTTVMQRFTQMLRSDVKAPRFTALLVNILADQQSRPGQSGIDKNVQDLTLYRAADAIQHCVAASTIFGRINKNALLLIQPSDIEPASRDAANRVRASLGTLGGLIDADSDIHINTMNLPSSTTISADEVVKKLETLTS